MQSEIDRHLNGTITNAQLAESALLSQYHFARMFRRSTGLSPQGYVLRRRIERAMHLMLSTDAPLCDIALDCGFTDQSHLSRRFAEALGAAPRAWRRERLSRQELSQAMLAARAEFAQSADSSRNGGRAASREDRVAMHSE